MNQAEVTKLVSRLRIPYGAKHRRLRNPEGPLGRAKNIRALVTALFKYERIEVMHYPGDEARGYAERLISDAIRYGDQHAETMEMANFWIEEKQLVHKLFKVLVPRYHNTTSSYTRMLNAPIPVATPEDSWPYFRSVIELRGNPYPPLILNRADNKLLIQNVLLEEAKREFRAAKYAEIARDLDAQANEKNEESSKVNAAESVAKDNLELEVASSDDKVADDIETTKEKSLEPK